MALLKTFIRLAAFIAALYGITGTTVYAQPAAAPLELAVLGSGGPGAAGRAASCYLVMIDGTPRILIDAGPGAFARLGEAKLSLSDTDIVLLTHLHVDHAGELPGLFKARAVSTGEPIAFKIWGPAGSGTKTKGACFPSTSRLIELLFGKRGAFAYLSDFAAQITIQAHDISAQVYKHSLPHVKIAKGTDLLVFNSVVLDPPASPAVLYTLHTPPHTIGEVAKDAGVRTLLLSHLSPAVEGMRPEVLASIRESYTGSVSFAEDGMHVRP